MPEKLIGYGHPTHIREVVGSSPTSGTNLQKEVNNMLKFLSKWLPPVSLITDAAFATCCFYEGWVALGILTALACAMTFVELFVISDYRKK